MAKWKLCRQIFGNEEFVFSEGDEVRIGRGLDNTITLSSIVISRNHCIINVKREGVFITDLKSSNGIYVGLKRIPPNIPYALSQTDLIGFGWTVGAPLVKILDSEKFVFKLIKCAASIISRIQYQSNSDDDIEAEISTYNFKKSKPVSKMLDSPTKNTKLQLKRKLNGEFNNVNVKNEPMDNGVINIVSDSDNESKSTEKKAKLITKTEDVIEEDIKYENEDLEYEAFNVKQEYLGYDEDEPIQIDSDSDSESEQWFLRLSQSSPGKPFTKIDQISLNSDMSKFDNIECNDNEEEDFIDDIITIPPEPTNQSISEINVPEIQTVTEIKQPDTGVTATTSPKVRPIIEVNVPDNELPLSVLSEAKEISEKDQVDKICNENNVQEKEKAIVPSCAIQQNSNNLIKKAQMIDPLVQTNKKKTHHSLTDSKSKRSSKKKKSKHSSSSIKKVITNSQKEERKRKLKEIADKEKKLDDDSKKSINNNKIVNNVRYTASNRGAFLTDTVNAVATVKPMKRRNSQEKEKNKLPPRDSVTTKEHSNSKKSLDKNKNYEKSKSETKESVSSTKMEAKDKNKVKETTSKFSSNSKSQKSKNSDHRNLKSQNENKESLPKMPISKVEPLPPTKPKKQVRFSDADPIVHEFEIEPGKLLKKTNSVKSRLLDVQQKPIYSLEKITLKRILDWKPHWLNVQISTEHILGHNHPPMTLFHSFISHSQYTGLVGDLLLMEIWECITQSYKNIRNLPNKLQLKYESLRCFELLLHLNVNISLATSEINKLPRVGEIIMLEFGPESNKNCRFFFVHNVRCLPSPQNNKNSFFSLALYASHDNKSLPLQPGDIMTGRTLAYINKELMLFEAMEYLAGSPLCQAILKPEPCHYQTNICDNTINMNTQWTVTLNSSQKLAVSRSVSAALGIRPSIQMVQGPPGTGKSSVICAIVMSYLYVATNKKQDRGKILICATSNAAVDELVIRLLNIRQSLPKGNFKY
ncbi:unnamed protein product [Euphydryas editha]|uniref:FHA domain-containing protein n=1 Tax=Euphydryas editha TaxID=104508 RepID=A0AAU9TTX2_EUPED|nr:unnamed protein product [Euphydryas editha]